MKIIEDIKSFTINRKRWLRGEGSEESCLLNTKTGKMCCLGFFAKQSKIPKNYIENVDTPCSARMLLNGTKVYSSNCKVISRPAKSIKWNTKLLSGEFHSATGDTLMDVNDDEEISDEIREKKITSLFKRIGITVKFIG